VRRPDGVKVALVPPHRESQGGFAPMPVRSNLTVSSLSRWRRAVRLLRLDDEREAAAGMVQRLSVRPADTEVPYARLSGGNKQKVIFGRVLFEQPHVYVLCEPTRGVDIATRHDIYMLIRELRDQGAAVLVVTSDSEDLFAVCDRIGVVQDGRVHALHDIADIKPEELEVFV
jgi:ribose transport system ATP-binding protein